MSSKKTKLYVIGPMSEHDNIRRFAQNVSRDAFDVRFVKPETKPFCDTIEQCIDNIAWADEVCAVLKPDGSMGNGTLYEYMFAKHLGKQVSKIRLSYDKT